MSAGGPAPPAGRAAISTFSTTVAVAALSLAHVLVISRVLGPDGRGDVVFLFTIAGLTSFICTLSVQEANANLAGQEPEKRPAVATNSVFLAAGLGLVGGAAVYGLGEIVPAARGDVEESLIWLILPAIPILILQNYLALFVRGDFAAGIANVALLIPAVLNLAINGTLALLGELTVTTAVVTWVATQTLATGTLAWYVATRLAGFGRPDAPLSRRSVSFGLKSHLAGVMAAGNYRLDQWLLGAISGSHQLGLYSVAVAWAEALFFLPHALTLAFRPDLVRATPDGARVSAAFSVRFAMIATVPLAVGLVVAAPFLCVTIIGDDFSGSVEQLRLLVPGAFGIVAIKILGNALVAQGRPLLETAAVAIAFVLTVALDVLLIPSHGGAGAAVASSLAYTGAGAAIGVIFLRALGGHAGELLPRGEDAALAISRLRTVLRPARQRGTP